MCDTCAGGVQCICDTCALWDVCTTPSCDVFDIICAPPPRQTCLAPRSTTRSPMSQVLRGGKGGGGRLGVTDDLFSHVLRHKDIVALSGHISEVLVSLSGRPPPGWGRAGRQEQGKRRGPGQDKSGAAAVSQEEKEEEGGEEEEEGGEEEVPLLRARCG